MTTKTCTKCNEAKATIEFSKYRKSPDGLQPHCKPCKSRAQIAYRLTEVGRSCNLYHANNHRHSMTVVQKAARDSTLSARVRSELSSLDLYGGTTFTEACEMTLTFVEERLRLEAKTGVAHHIDHIVPIAAGGTHTKENLQVLTAKENITKGASE